MARCIVEESKDEWLDLTALVVALLEEEHEPNPSGCAACRALALIRDGKESILWRARNYL